MTVTIDATAHPHYIALLKERLGLTPRETIEEFFSWHDPDSVQKDLLELLFEAMRSECADGWDRRVRDHKIFLCELLAQLVTATYIRYKTAPPKKKTVPVPATCSE